MRTLCVLSFVILASFWSSSEAVDDEIEIGELTLLRGSHQYRKESFDCPAIYGRYPHERDCSMFYECRYGYAHLMKCSRGKLYDEKKEQCNDSRRVKCDRSGKDNNDQDRDHDHKDLEKDEDLNAFRCPYIWGTFAHPIDCSKYFVCAYNIPSLFHCYGSDLYDERSRKCLDKRRVHCGKRLDRDQLKTTKRPVQTTSRRLTTEGQKTSKRPVYTTSERPRHTSERPRHTTERHRYTTERPRYTTERDRYRTTENFRSTEERFRTSKRPYVTTSQRPRYTTTTEFPTTEEDHQTFRCPFPRGRFADPLDCSRFYECRSSIPAHHNCPKSTLYDERKEDCVKDKYVRCGDRPGGVDGDDDKNKDKKKEVRCPYSWGTYFHPEDCSKYIVCIYDVPTVFSCAKNQLFHVKHRRCLPKDQVTCDFRINPDDPNPQTPNPRLTTTFKTTKTPTMRPTNRTTGEIPTRIPTTSTTSRPTTQTPETTILQTTQTPETTILQTTQTPETTILQTTQTPETTILQTTQTPETTILQTTQTPEATTRPTTQSLETTTIIPTSSETTKAPITTSVPTTSTTLLPETTVVSTTKISTTQSTTKVPKPNTPPPTDCEEDDLDCIIDDTGDVRGWFDCPERYGHFAHGSSRQLFIHCDNWYPYVKKCADDTVFSPTYLVCMWSQQQE